MQDMNSSHAPQLPLGLGMALAQDTDALNYFGSLGNAAQEKIVKYIQASQTGQEAKNRIRETVSQMKQHVCEIPQMF